MHYICNGYKTESALTGFLPTSAAIPLAAGVYRGRCVVWFARISAPVCLSRDWRPGARAIWQPGAARRAEGAAKSAAAAFNRCSASCNHVHLSTHRGPFTPNKPHGEQPRRAPLRAAIATQKGMHTPTHSIDLL